MGKMMKTFFGIRKIHLLTSPGSLSLSSVPKFRQTVPTTVPKLNSETEKKFSSTYLVQHFDNSYDYLLYLAFRTSILIISMNIFFIQLLEPAFHFLEKLSLFLLSIHNQYYIYCFSFSNVGKQTAQTYLKYHMTKSKKKRLIKV